MVFRQRMDIDDLSICQSLDLEFNIIGCPMFNQPVQGLIEHRAVFHKRDILNIGKG